MKICPECLERVDDDLDFCPDDGTELRTIHAREEDPMEGRVLDEKWVIESKIGGGGMGAVYRGHQLSVDRPVAVKVLRSDLSEDDEHVQRFFREANVASNVSDPRCVTIYDFGQTENDHVLYLAMEHLEGQSLHDRRESGPVSLRDTAEIGIEISAALESLHGLGIVHRDLKPENVYLVDDVGEELFLKVLDFGLAKVAQSDATPVTASGQVFGTPEFMSPEQCMGAEVGPKSDLYSLGCLLYELITGRTPFGSNSSVEVLLAHVNREPPPVRRESGVPEDLADLVMELLEKDPGDRPASSVAVRERLREIRDGFSEDTADFVPASEPTVVATAETMRVERAESNGADQTEGGKAGARQTPSVAQPEESVESGDEQYAGLSRGLVAAGVAAAVLGFGIAVYLAGLFDRSGAESVESRRDPGSSAAAFDSARSGAVGARRRAVQRAAALSAGTGWAEEASVRATFLAGATKLERAGSERGRAGGRGARAGAGGESGPSRSGAGEGASAGRASSGGSDSAESEEHAASLGVPFLTEAGATRKFQSRASAVEECIVKNLPGKLSSPMTVRVELIVSADGVVQSVEVRESTGHSSGLRTCVEDVVDDLEFAPTKTGSGMRLVHPYQYGPSRSD